MPFWIRRLVNFLRRLPVVLKVQLRCDRISVTYKTGFRRNYIWREPRKRRIYARALTREEGIISQTIPIGSQFQWALLNRPDLKKYFFVHKKKIKKATYIEQDILVHELMCRIIEMGYTPPYYSEQDIQDDLTRIRETINVYRGGAYTRFPPYKSRFPRPGRPIIETYFDIADMRRTPDNPESTLRFAFSQKGIIYTALQYLIKAKVKRNLTIQSFDLMLYRMGFGPIIPNPTMYKVMLDHLLEPAGKVISDAHPGLGGKAIAASILGVGYQPLNSDLDAALTNGLGTIGLKLDAGKDILVYDNNFNRVDIEQALDMGKGYKKILVYVQSDQLEQAKKYKPARVVRIKTKAVVSLSSVDYLFVFR